MKTVCVDLNGVLDTYTGWKGSEHEDPPREGAAEFLQVLRDRGYQVVLFSTRPREKVRGWLEQHGLDQLVNQISAVKVPAVAYIDDRALCFRGDFAATLAELEGFKAHWEGPTEPVSRGAELIAAERRRQVEIEGWDAEHDDAHADGSLAVIAAALAVSRTGAAVLDAYGRGTPGVPDDFGERQEGDAWGLLAKHGANRVRALTIAGALIAAEIDRQLRAQAKGATT